jgi:hypothetical protein
MLEVLDYKQTEGNGFMLQFARDGFVYTLKTEAEAIGKKWLTITKQHNPKLIDCQLAMLCYEPRKQIDFFKMPDKTRARAKPCTFSDVFHNARRRSQRL